MNTFHGRLTINHLRLNSSRYSLKLDKKIGSSVNWHFVSSAPVAQLDRAPGYEPGGLEVRTLSGAMIIQAFPSGPYQTNAYVVACQLSKKAALIDPSPGSYGAMSEFIAKEKLIPEKIILTHTHWDHIADVAKCKRAYLIPVWAHPLDKPNMETPGVDKVPGLIDLEGVPVESTVDEGDRFLIGEIEVVVVFTPGHTPGGVCYYVKQQHVLFSGDTLFRGSMGRVDLPTGNPTAMWKSLKKLAILPSETVVYPGHGLHTTIGRESWLANAEHAFG